MNLNSFLRLWLLLQAAFAVHGKLIVVATLPDYAALAREMGGEWVDVTALGKATEDPHFVDARYSLVVKLRQADVLIEGGGELEQGWLPPLLQTARNSRIETGAPGRVIAAEGIHLLGAPAELTRAAGDVHALGNPHFMVDPILAKTVAHHLAEVFSRLDPSHRDQFQANDRAFEATINGKLQVWGALLKPYQGVPLVAYHDSWLYFARRFGFKLEIFLEAKPGIPPSPAHLADVIARVKSEHARAILVEPFHNRKVAERVATATGIPVVHFAQFPGALPQTETYVALMDVLVGQLAAALKQ
jgi:zinc/manganese transport system substrate-binding protein